MSRLKEGGRFTANNARGEVDVVVILKELIDVGDLDVEDAVIEGTPTLVLARTGEHVNRIAKGRYQLQNGEELFSSDPKCV